MVDTHTNRADKAFRKALAFMLGLPLVLTITNLVGLTSLSWWLVLLPAYGPIATAYFFAFATDVVLAHLRRRGRL